MCKLCEAMNKQGVTIDQLRKKEEKLMTVLMKQKKLNLLAAEIMAKGVQMMERAGADNRTAVIKGQVKFLVTLEAMGVISFNVK